ncbi:MAG: phosphoribosyl-AMP cyclohydrolase [bacterium]|nr:phosphoribosyl-AMP cyclohydrolase [bacterium]
MKSVQDVDFAKGNGLVPVIVQEIGSNEVLMLAYINAEAFVETVSTDHACYFSRKKQALWRKGEESGNVQKVLEIRIDCDNDTILLKVEQVGGAACHKGYKSCFFRALDGIDEWKVVEERVFDPKEVYKKGDQS